MRHSYFGKQLSRTHNERQRLLSGLARDVIVKGNLLTTLTKAKAVQSLVEKLISKAKRAAQSDLIRIRQELHDGKVVKKLLEDAKSRFANRQSGFTRIVKMGARRGDAAEMVWFGFVDEQVVTGEVVKEKKKGKVKVENKTKIKSNEK